MRGGARDDRGQGSVGDGCCARRGTVRHDAPTLLSMLPLALAPVGGPTTSRSALATRPATRRPCTPTRRSTCATSTSPAASTRARLGHVEPERQLRLDVRARVVRRAPDPGVHLLPDAPIAPAVGATEQAKDLSNMRDPATMRAYWADYSLLLRRVAAGGRVANGRDPRRARSVGLSRAGPRGQAGPLVRAPADRAPRTSSPRTCCSPGT